MTETRAAKEVEATAGLKEAEYFVAVIGDIVASRKLNREQRRTAQSGLMRMIERLNVEFGEWVAGAFAITQGDEFEGLLRVQGAENWLPALIWRVEELFPSPVLRLGIGLGEVDTDIPVPAGSAVLLDGPAFHKARAAVVQAAKEKQMGGVFLGFGSGHDAILNGLARVLFHQRSRWSGQQRRLALLLHSGLKQSEAAERMGHSRQAISAYAKAAGWNAYVEGESGLRSAIAETVHGRSGDITGGR